MGLSVKHVLGPPSFLVRTHCDNFVSNNYEDFFLMNVPEGLQSSS